MRFHVVDLTTPTHVNTPGSAEAFQDAPSITSVMWVPFPRSLDPNQIDFYIANTPSNVRRSDVIAIGLPPSYAQSVLHADHILDDLSRRLEGAPLFLVYHDNKSPTIRQVRGEKVEGMESASTLRRVRECDIAEVVRRPGAELPRQPGLHYEGPNDDHYGAFLRPGFAARSIDELDRIAFWLAPLLLTKKFFLVDHWSMISIAYHVGRYLRELGNSSIVSVESLRNYDEDRDVLVRRLKGTFGPIESTAGAILVSVNSSGRLVRNKLLPAMIDVGFDSPCTIAVAKTPNQPEYALPSLTTLDADFTRHDRSHCPLCLNDNATLIPIQHDSYLLNLVSFTKRVAIKRQAAKESSETIARYRAIDAFRVHKTHPDGRHHAYFIDVLPILKQKEFCSRLSNTLEAWNNIGIDLIVHPNHEAAKELAKLTSKYLGNIEVFACNEREIRQLEPTRLRRLLRAQRICVVDDVVVSGARLFGYRTAINTIRRNNNLGQCELYCLVGIARTVSEKALMSVSDVLHHSPASPRFLSVERLFLPQWEELECRWCAELRLLSSLSEELRALPLIQNRIQALSDRSGLVDDLFLSWTCSSSDIVDYWKLGPSSIFGEVQGADLAVSVAAAIQRMRGECRKNDNTWQESELDEVFRSPIAKVLDPQFYLVGRYYEPVLVAAILRATKIHDVRAPDIERCMQSRLATLAGAEMSKELHGELMLASVLNQLPVGFLDLAPEPHPHIAALRDAIVGA